MAEKSSRFVLLRLKLFSLQRMHYFAMKKACKKAQIDIDFLSGFFLFIMVVAYIAFSVSSVFPKYIAQSAENNMNLEAWQASENFMSIVENNSLDTSVPVTAYYSPIWDTDNDWNRGTHNGTISAAGDLVMMTWHAPYSLWQYRKRIIINGSTSELINYAMMINLTNTSSPSDNFDFSKAKPDGSDATFTWFNKTGGVEQSIPFWIENWTAVGSKGNATIWVNIPNIIANTNTTLYMYYGNPAAISASDGFATFDVFDDFNDGSLSGAWVENFDTPLPAYSETNQRYEIEDIRSKKYGHIQRVGIPQQTFEAVTKIYFASTSDTSEKLGGGLAIWFNHYDWTKIYLRSNQDMDVMYSKADGETETLGNPATFDDHKWYWLRILAGSSDVRYYLSDNARNWNFVGTIPRIPGWRVDPGSLIILGQGYEDEEDAHNPHLNNNDGAGGGDPVTYYYDDIRVRKYATPEPVVLSVAEDAGSNKSIYLSNTVNTGRTINVTPIINKYEPNPNVNLTVEVSANGGTSWIRVANGTTYTSASGAGIGTGTQLKFRVNFSTDNRSSTASLHNLTLKYWADVTVSLLTCKGYNYNDMISRESYGVSKKLLNVDDLGNLHLTFDTLFFGITNTGNSTHRNGTVTLDGVPYTVSIRSTGSYFDEAEGTDGVWSNKSILVGANNYDVSKIDYDGNFVILRNRIIDCGPNIPALLSSAVVRRFGVYNGSFAAAELIYW